MYKNIVKKIKIKAEFFKILLTRIPILLIRKDPSHVCESKQESSIMNYEKISRSHTGNTGNTGPRRDFASDNQNLIITFGIPGCPFTM